MAHIGQEFGFCAGCLFRYAPRASRIRRHLPEQNREADHEAGRAFLEDRGTVVGVHQLVKARRFGDWNIANIC